MDDLVFIVSNQMKESVIVDIILPTAIRSYGGRATAEPFVY